MREITVATVQMKPELGNSENNLVKMSDYISTITSQQKVDLIVFPELITSGYELGVKFTEMAQRVPGPAINLMAQRAADAGVYIAFGLATKEKVESIIYNSAILVGPEGELIGQYNKVHLRGEERMAFREGFKMPIFDTGEIGKIGLMVGWDLAFPEVARAMTLEGAELLCVCANWETDYIDEWKTFMRSRAYENAIYMAGANRVGEDVTMKFGGESMIVGPRGKVYAALEAEQKAFDLKDAKKPEVKEDPKVLKEMEEERAAKAKEAAAAGKPEASKDGEPSANKPDEKKDGIVTPVQPVTAGGTATAAVAEAKTEVKEELKKPAKVQPTGPAEGYCVARFDLDDVRRFREEFQTLQSRQPIAYRSLVKRY